MAGLMAWALKASIAPARVWPLCQPTSPWTDAHSGTRSPWAGSTPFVTK